LIGILKTHCNQWPELRVIVTSATLDTSVFSKYLGGCPVIEIPGRMFPVDIAYNPLQGSFDDASKTLEKVLSQAFETHTTTPFSSGDILCFLTGQDEVERAKTMFQAMMNSPILKSKTAVFSLYGKQLPEEQQEVFKKQEQGIRKVIFSTDVAETSVTIDGVRYVIDSGLTKENVFDSKRNITMLKVMPITKSSAIQRKGRAGRTSTGTCIRLYSEEDYNGMSDNIVPEIKRRPLSLVVSSLLAMNIDAVNFDWVEPPELAALEKAKEELSLLGAITPAGGLSELGHAVAELQIEPSLVRLLFTACKLGLGEAGVVLAGLITVASMVYWRGGDAANKKKADEHHKVFFSDQGDMVSIYKIYQQWTSIFHGHVVTPPAPAAEHPTEDEAPVEPTNIDYDFLLHDESQNNENNSDSDESVASTDSFLDTLEDDVADLDVKSEPDQELEPEEDVPEKPDFKLRSTKASRKNAKTWCMENFLNSKALGLADSTAKELQHALKRIGFWNFSPSQNKIARDADIQVVILYQPRYSKDLTS
jgi:HrpA-like RNA helicase